MNIGVSTTPWGVVSRPARAWVEPSAGGGVRISKLTARRGVGGAGAVSAGPPSTVGVTR
jgi:hypothetical protein